MDCKMFLRLPPAQSVFPEPELIPFPWLLCAGHAKATASPIASPSPGAKRLWRGAKLPVQSPARRAVAGREAVWLARALPCLRPYFKETGQRLPLSVCFPRPRFHPPPSPLTGGGESRGRRARSRACACPFSGGTPDPFFSDTPHVPSVQPAKSKV